MAGLRLPDAVRFPAKPMMREKIMQVSQTGCLPERFANRRDKRYMNSNPSPLCRKMRLNHRPYMCHNAVIRLEEYRSGFHGKTIISKSSCKLDSQTRWQRTPPHHER